MAIIDPENIEWTEVAQWKNRLPKDSGCYLIMLGDTPLYAGKAVNLYARFALHQLDRNRVCYRDYKGDPSTITVKYVLLPKHSIGECEKAIIRHFKPLMNVCFNRE